MAFFSRIGRSKHKSLQDSSIPVKFLKDRMYGFFYPESKSFEYPFNAGFCSSSGGSGNLNLIKQLRERTGAPMKDVKNSLVANGWDLESAFTELRKKGLAAASKKAGRVAAEGLIGIAETKNSAMAAIEINCETDFVARNEIFQHLVKNVAQAALELESKPDSQDCTLPLPELENAQMTLSHPKLSGSYKISEAVAEVSAITGEHVRLRRAFKLSSTSPSLSPSPPPSSGLVASYLHSSPVLGMGRIAGIVHIQTNESDSIYDDNKIIELSNNLAMHIVASRPLFLNSNSVPAHLLQHEKNILMSQASSSGKSESVIQKMVNGRLRKYFEEVVLLEQKFILDETKKIQGVLDAFSKEIGKNIFISNFLRIEVGEGIEKEEKDFNAEVLAAQNS